MQVLQKLGQIQHSSQEDLNAVANIMTYCKPRTCVSGYLKAEQWENTNYTKYYLFLYMHQTINNEKKKITLTSYPWICGMITTTRAAARFLFFYLEKGSLHAEIE
jgi:hypothetical protein